MPLVPNQSVFRFRYFPENLECPAGWPARCVHLSRSCSPSSTSTSSCTTFSTTSTCPTKQLEELLSQTDQITFKLQLEGSEHLIYFSMSRFLSLLLMHFLTIMAINMTFSILTPSMVYISVTNTHITNYNLSHDGPLWAAA